MKRYEGNRVKWLIDKQVFLFLARCRRSLRRTLGRLQVCDRQIKTSVRRNVSP